MLTWFAATYAFCDMHVRMVIATLLSTRKTSWRPSNPLVWQPQCPLRVTFCRVMLLSSAITSCLQCMLPLTWLVLSTMASCLASCPLSSYCHAYISDQDRVSCTWQHRTRSSILWCIAATAAADMDLMAEMFQPTWHPPHKGHESLKQNPSSSDWLDYSVWGDAFWQGECFRRLPSGSSKRAVNTQESMHHRSGSW